MECQKKCHENITKSDSNFAPTFVDPHLLPEMNFYEHCFIKSNIPIPKVVINLFISYILQPDTKYWRITLIFI